jgi:hypothetical protein
MKAAHAIVAWTPAKARRLKTRGQVLVGQWQFRTAPHWALRYAKLKGATSGVRRSMTDTEALQALRSDYAELRADGIPADAINEAFRAIDGWLPL